MVSVTQRIAQIKQPRGGYIPPKFMHEQHFNDDRKLYPDENLSAAAMGVMVDYLTRYAQTGEVKMAFDIPLKGLQLAKSYSPGLPMIAEAKELIPKIKDFSEESLNAATKFTTYFDTYYRAGPRAVQYLKPEAPNEQTRKNMMIMVDRAITFFTDVSPLLASDLTFEGGYTSTIDKGDADFMSKTILWDMKVSKNPPLNKYTLQLVVYYLLAKHSDQPIYHFLKSVGIFNPRLNVAYTLDIAEIDPVVISTIEQNVIGY